jgi:hypothetical protein
MSSCDSIVKTNLIFGGCKLFVSLHLNNWLDLSLNHSLPSYLLILSRYLTTVLRISLVERYSRLIPSVEHFASQGKVKPEGCWSYTCFFAGWGCGYCLYDSIAIWRFCFRQEKIGVSWNARCIIYAIFFMNIYFAMHFRLFTYFMVLLPSLSTSAKSGWKVLIVYEYYIIIVLFMAFHWDAFFSFQEAYLIPWIFVRKLKLWHYYLVCGSHFFLRESFYS